MRKFNVTVNGKTYEVDVEEIGGAASAPVAAAPVAAPVAAPTPAPAPAAAPAPAPAAAPAGEGTKVTAPMPGSIVSIKVNVGDKVTADSLVVVMEAMKMENEIFAGVDGTVTSVVVSAGATVNTGDVLVTIA